MSLVQSEEIALLPTAARAATYTSPDLQNLGGHSALTIILDATAIGTATLTVSINGKDPGSGKYYQLLAGAAVSTNSTNRYRISPTLGAVANAVAQDELPPTFQIVVTQGGTGNATYSLGYTLVR